MQWIVETIESPATGSLDAGLDQGSGNDVNSFAHDLLHTLKAIRAGDFSIRLADDHGGVAGEIAETLNAITAANQRIVHQLTRVGEEVGREGKTGQRVKFALSNGGWGEMEASINALIDDLVWPITALTRAVAAIAQGDLAHAVALSRDGYQLKGEFLQSATTVNATINQLRACTSEITGVMREVATEGRLGGQVHVGEVTGVWQALIDAANVMLSALAEQVRGIVQVVTAVADGDLKQSLTVKSKGEVGALAETVNALIANLRLISDRNIERDWVEVNLAKLTSMLQGHRDVSSLGRLLLSELTPLIDAQLGVIYRTETENGASYLKVVAARADDDGRLYSQRLPLGAGLIGQCAVDNRRILVTQMPARAAPTGFAMLNALPQNVVLLPVAYGNEVKAIIELASASAFTPRQMTFLEQLTASFGNVLNTIEATIETERLLKLLQDSDDRCNLALAAGNMGSWEWDLVDGGCVWDDRQKQIFGVDRAPFEVVLPNIRELVDRRDWKMLCQLLKKARQDGGSNQVEFRVRRPDGGVRWCLGRAAAVKDASGRILRLRGVTMDITDRKEAEDRQSLLAREVDHRTKNALSVVHAIVSLTRAEDIKQFSAAVEGRIQALARAHSLLSDSRWRGAKIADLIQGELAPHRAPNIGRVRISGKSLALPPSAVQALALAVHELATNAVKYGALSGPSGTIDVAWEAHGGQLELKWIERGGPPAELKVQGGFGMRVIKASVEAQLSGTVEFDWQPEGLQCRIRVPCRTKTEMLGKIPLIREESLAGRNDEAKLARLDLNALAHSGAN
jgi:PAS domain S-box-containing protein